MNRYKRIFANGIWEYMKGAHDIGLNAKLNKHLNVTSLHITKNNMPETEFGTEVGTIKVTSFHHMFEDCVWIKEIIFDKDIVCDNITNTRCMFKNCYNLERVIMPKNMFPNVVDVRYMFQNCNKLVKVDLI